MRKLDTERVEIPMGMANTALRRVQPCLKVYASMARCGTFDLNGLSMSCYMQGLHDAMQLVANHPEIAAPLIANAKEEASAPIPSSLPSHSRRRSAARA